MFAGAAREAVFSQAENIRRINADFVPVALKAGLVYNRFFQNIPPSDDEDRLYRELARSMPAPQGIGVVNSAGKVLDWTMAFDDDKNVLVFLDHARKRFAKFPGAKQPVPTERYAKFPSQQAEDVEDSGVDLPVVDRHQKGQSCPAKPLLQKGTVDARLFGRALEKDGKLVADTVRQENYVEDRFQIPVPMQERLTKALAGAGSARFRIDDDLAQLLAGHAYLGQLDLNPCQGSLIKCEFWGRKVKTAPKGPSRIQIEGTSEAAGASSPEDQRARIDGAFWQHEVKLVWEGSIEVREGRVARLLLLGNGSEKLRWDNKHQPLPGKADVASLTAGHAIDRTSAVRYGIIGEPIADSEASTASTADQDSRIIQVPEEARRQLVEAFGPTCLVFQDKVQTELGLSVEQKRKVEGHLSLVVQEAQKFFRDLNDQRPEEREKALGSYRMKVQGKLAAFLKETLKDDQLKRLRQLELQQDGLFALGRPEIMMELKLTDEQRRQFMGVVQQVQQEMESMMKEAQAGGNPAEIRPKLMKIRKQHEDEIEALLSDDQKKRWRALVGKPFALDH